MTDYAAAFPSLEFERLDEGILAITLRAEGRLNAISSAMHGELATVWTAIDKDPDTRVVLVRGAGGNFSSGGDLDLIDEIISDFDARARVLQETRDLVYNVINCRKPIVTAVQGVTFTIGIELMLAGDIVVAADDARFCQMEPKRGIAPLAGAQFRMLMRTG